MERLFYKIIERDDVKRLISEITVNNRYKNINIPMTLDNNYYFDDKYALFLLLDSIIKYDIIINSEKYIEEYVSQLRRLFKRISSYQDITKGINKTLANICLKILELSNHKTSENKEKILRYIYKKYIVEGYFYYGFSSCSSNEIDFSGIKKEGFILDSRLDEVNSILKKYENKDIIKRVKSDITDNFVVASYYAILGPDYLEKIATSQIFAKDCYNKSCFYTKDINTIISNMKTYIKNKHLTKEEENIIVNNLYNVLTEENINNSNGIIAFIKRSYINKNYLKNIEEIIEGSKDLDIENSISMIMESRYSSYELDNDILPLYLEYLSLPRYQELCNINITNNNYETIIIEESDTSLEQKNTQETKKVSNTYGFISIFMLLLLILIVIVVVLLIIKGIGAI